MRILLVFLFIAIITATSLAQVPRQFTYQGTILENGTPLQGPVTIQVIIYDSIQGGHSLFSDQFSETIANGIFNLQIGSGLPLPPSLNFSRPCFVGVSINGGSELPRTPILSAPYSLHSTTADTALAFSGSVKGVVTNINALSGDIVLQGAGTTTVNLKEDTLVITSNAAGDTGIQGLQNLDGSLSISKPNGPIATIGIADSAITTKFLASDAVTNSRISDAAVTGGKIAQATVTTTNISTQGVSTGTVLTATGSSTPNWQLVNLASSVTGTLPVANGGTGQSAALVPGGILYGASATAAGSSQTGTTGQVLTSAGNAQPTWQTPSYVLSGTLVAFPDSNGRAGYSYTGSAEVKPTWTSASATGFTTRSAPAACVFGGKLYVIGGYNPNTGAVNSNQVFDPANGIWSSKSTSGFTARWGAAAVVFGEQIYVIGGAGTGQIVEAYNPSTDTWQTKGSLIVPAQNTSAVEVGSRIYCIGGYNPAQNPAQSNAVQSYDSSTNQWTNLQLGNVMPTARDLLTSDTLNSIVYSIGGRIGSGATTNAVEAFNPATQSWSTKTSSGLLPRWGQAHAMVNGIIYVFGGQNEGKSVQCYNPLSDSWSTLSSIGVPPSNQDVAVAVGSNIYLISSPRIPGTGIVKVFNPSGVTLYWYRKN